ncbi:hypothetical protein Bbelb_119460 [Branchiostoma belcheri]|nr:hypothetical protein Bbelb_119460 [Branchiostoma belcheri]
MGNCGSVRVAESATPSTFDRTSFAPQAKDIQFDTEFVRMIKNPFPGYGGWLLEQSGRNGNPTWKVGQEKMLTTENKQKERRLESGKFRRHHDNCRPASVPDETPSPGSREVLFASRGDFHHAITVSQNTMFAELEDQGAGSAIEAQLFRLEYPLMRRAQGSSESTVGALEIVPFTLKPIVLGSRQNVGVLRECQRGRGHKRGRIDTPGSGLVGGRLSLPDGL